MSIEAMSWAEAHFSGADLGDARPTKRLVAVMARMAEAPDESIPTRMGTVAGAKAAYRLFATGAVTHVFATGAVTHASVMAPHRRLCLAEAAHHPVVLMVHDDTLLDLSGHPSLPETGRLGNGHGTGFIAHSGLAGLPNREVLGLVHQAIWARPPKDTPDVPSESRVWSDTVTSVGSAPEEGTFLSVGDRGADVFDHLVTARAAGWEVVVRAYHDRRMADGQRSLTALRQAKAQGAATVQTKRPRTERSPSASPGVLWRSSHRVVAPTPPSGSPGSGSGATAWSGFC